MSLLDYFDSPNAQLGLGLLAAAAPRSDGAGFGQRLMEGVQSGQSMRDAQTKRKMIDMQMQEAQRKIEDEQRRRAWRTSLPGVMNQKVYGSSDEGPTMAPDAMGLQNHLMSPDSPFADEILKRKLFPKPEDGFTLSEGQQRFSPDGSVIARGAAKAPDLDPKIKQYEYAKQNGYKGSFEQFVVLGPALMAAAQAPMRDAQIGNIEAENAYNLPLPRRTVSGGAVSVTLPDGRSVSFPNQSAANSFKMKAGIK